MIVTRGAGQGANRKSGREATRTRIGPRGVPREIAATGIGSGQRPSGLGVCATLLLSTTPSLAA